MTPSKRKGTAWEVAVKNYLDSRGVAVFRTALTGKRDTGDLEIPTWSAIGECKNTKTIDLAGAVDQARIEAHNAGRRFGLAIIKRRGAGAAKAYVVMELDDFVTFATDPF